MAKKVTMLLAVLLGTGMILTGIASAEPEKIYLEIQAGGKGYQADTDNNTGVETVYIESKHKLDTIIFYAECDRATGEITFAYRNKSSKEWESSDAAFIQTEESLLIHISALTPIYKDNDNVAINLSGTLKVQLKNQEGIVKSAKLKSLATSYWQNKDDDSANTQLFGALKMKGKKVEPENLPKDIRELFGLLI